MSPCLYTPFANCRYWKGIEMIELTDTDIVIINLLRIALAKSAVLIRLCKDQIGKEKTDYIVTTTRKKLEKDD